MKDYKVFSNWDLSGLGTILTPESGGSESPLNKAHVQRLIKDSAGSSVDAILCCPTILRCPLWDSAARPYWSEPESDIPIPPIPDCKNSSQRTMKRVREYVKAGGDPLRETYEAVRACGMDFFFSLRMNDWHNLNEITPDNHDEYPTVDRFYKQHPEYRVGEINEHNTVGWKKMNPYTQDYMHEEVREHYLALVDELLNLFPVDGLELDFMRCGNYFKESQLEQGTRVMTEFILKVRKRLDETGRELPLCLRMPAKFDECAMLGFDLVTLAKQNAFQYVTISSSYIEGLDLEIEKFKQNLPGVKVFGEIQSMVMNGAKNGWPFERRMTDEMYYAAANSILRRGADGITLFNYQFLRPLVLAGHKKPQEPDIGNEVLRHLTDRGYLRTCGKHYFVSPAYAAHWDDVLPAVGTFPLEVRLFDDPALYKSAKLRLVSKQPGLTAKAALRGVALSECGSGELYSPFTNEGLPEPGEAVSFTVDTALLSGINTFEITSEGEVYLAELALYV